MLVERKVLKIMIYNQLVEAHNLLCESEDYNYNDRTEVAPEGFYDMTKVSSDDKKISKVDASSVIKSLEDHLETQYTKISDERKNWLRNNVDTIDMIFDPITPSERAFLINIKADKILKLSKEREQKRREEELGINKDVDDIIGGYTSEYDPAESTFPPIGSSIENDIEDTIKLSRRHGGKEDTLPTGVVGSGFDSDDESTFNINDLDENEDKSKLYEMRLSRGSLIRKKYYGRY